jgi:glycosyltransferase involved in cell wall biosynthesis
MRILVIKLPGCHNCRARCLNTLLMQAVRRRKIAYYTINDPLDKRSWSGVTYYLGKTLQQHVGDVDFLGPVPIPWLLDKTCRALQKTSRLFFRSEWIPKYSLLKNVYASWYLGRKMKGKYYDFIMAPAAAPELAYLSTKVPIIYFCDATYKIYSETYVKEFANLGAISRWEGNHLESKSLHKSKLAILSSRWAANSAISDYKLPADKVEIMLLGANIEQAPERSIIYKKQNNTTLTLLFLAVDWDRKGGKIAFDALVQLHAQGLKAKLIVCGCTPPAEYQHPGLEVIPFINKNLPQDYDLFVQILSTSHFLILPTRADCSLLVAMESNSYGMPAITTEVGGVPDVVLDGVNGYCLPLEAEGKAYAELIAEIYADQPRYQQLIESSRKRFDEELSWTKWTELFEQALQKRHL